MDLTLDGGASGARDMGAHSRGHAGQRECGSVAGQRWFAVQARPGRERLAKASLTAAEFQAFLPLALIRRERTGEVETPLFPSYLFALFDVRRDPWGEIMRQPGVLRLLGENKRPRPLPHGFVEGLLVSASLRGVVSNLTPQLAALAAGDEVLLLAGPFADHRGRVLWASGERVRLLFTLFGRPTEAEVARGDVAPWGGEGGCPPPMQSTKAGAGR